MIHAENIWKKYDLGVIGYGTLRADLQSWWATQLGREDPNRPITDGIAPELSVGSFWALQEVSFDIHQGEVMGIIGRNGAGKSTLLKILSRLTAPSKGELKLKGKVASLLEVGTGFHPELTGRENVFLNGAILGMTKQEVSRKFVDIVSFAGIEKFIDTPVKRYSSGMYVRLAFSVGAHLESEIFIVDEVLAVGDLQFQKKCLKKLQDIQKEGRTILFVSHGPEMVKKLCDRCIWLEKGIVKSIGVSDAVVSEYVGMTVTTMDTPVEEEENNNGPFIDLSRFKNKYGHDAVRVESLELLNAVDAAFCVPWDEPIKLGIIARFHQEIENVEFAVGVTTTDDVPLFTVRNTDSAEPLPNISRGSKAEVKVHIPHNLRAGQYKIHLGIVSDHEVKYYNPQAACLIISDKGKGIYKSRNVGLINLSADWEVDA